nr:hypothetical protein GCM10020092_037340 [Actinoplanes digitatis]
MRQWWLDYCCDDSVAGTPGVTADSWVNELYRRDGERRGQRGFSLSRIGASFPAYTTPGPSGPWAEHRSTVHFTGDTRPDWESLRFAAAMTPAEASIGVSYVSHDIGSFAGKHLPGDLYLRWVQLGAFQPILRLHSDHGDRLPWEYTDAVGGLSRRLPAPARVAGAVPVHGGAADLRHRAADGPGAVPRLARARRGVPPRHPVHAGRLAAGRAGDRAGAEHHHAGVVPAGHLDRLLHR